MDFTDGLIKNHPFLSSLIFNAVAFALTLSFFDIFYMGNDDVGMMLYIRGIGIVESATPNVLFINIIFSYVIFKLYQWFDFVDWYPLSFLIVIYASYTCISYLIFKYAEGIYVKALYLAIFSSVCLKPIFLLQFTIVAGIAGVAGVLGLLVAEDDKNRLFALLLIAISALIRFQSCMLVVVMFAPIYAYKIISFKSLQDIFKNSAWIKYLFVSIALSFGLEYLNMSHHNNYDKTIRFYSFNSARGEILDKGALRSFSTQERKSILNKVGWSENDYYMLINWFFMNQEIYNIESFEELAKYRPKKDFKNFMKHIGDEKTVEEIKDVIKLPVIFHFFLILSAVSIYCFSLEKLIFTALAYAWFFLTYFLIGFFFRTPPERVFIVMSLATAISFFAICIIKPKKGIFDVTSSEYLKLLLILIGLYPIQKIIRDNRYTMAHNWTYYYKESNYQKEALQSAIEDLTNRGNIELLVSWGAAFPYEYIKPFEDISYLKKINIFSLGTHQVTPEARAVLAKLSVSDLYTAIAERPGVYLLIGKAYNFIETQLYQTYMIERYGKQVQWQEINSLFNQLNGSRLFKVSFTPTTPSEPATQIP